MPQGQFSAADIDQQAPPAGRFTAADVDSNATPKNDGFWLDLAHRLIANNPVTAGKAVIGAGGLVNDNQPARDFKWSDVHPSLHNLIRNTADELKRTFAPNAGTAVGNLISLAQTARPVSPGTISGAASSAATAARPAVTTALRTVSDIADPDLIGSFSPRAAHWQRLAGKAADVLDKLPTKQAVTPSLSPAEAIEGESWREPEQPSITARSQAKVNQPQPTKTEYPEGLQKRPTDRAEIVSDKAIQDSMRNNLEQHGWQALSQERKEFFANNGPQLGKADLIAQARAEAIRAEAEQRAQAVLAEAANPTVKLTKMPKAKVPAAAKAQPIAEDLNSPSRLVDLMQQSIDLINTRKGNK